ncbi:MAG: hypothetical protein CXT67_09125 [Methanobacteriota archaeon]|jgi:hypothetical protein|nr:MAG: hypothetical protein CXT67_09125 [Euryarchaeota archaeon]HIG20769.1 DUF1844 domain-containing protein [Candidatus Poseidoniales archaeon]
MVDEFLQSEESQQFFGLIQMLQRSALVALGKMPNHEGKYSVNIAEAKAAIDLIAVIQKRTEGNIDEMETNVLRGIVTEMRMMFVQAPKDIATKEAEEEDAEELKKTFIEPSEAPAEVLTNDSKSEEE